MRSRSRCAQRAGLLLLTLLFTSALALPCRGDETLLPFRALSQQEHRIVYRDMEPTSSHDVFWIFVLWRALHSQDAPLEEIAAAVIASMWQFLPSSEDSFGTPPIAATLRAPAVAAPAFSTIEESDPECDFAVEAFSEFGDEQSRQPCELFCDDPREFSIHHNYFKFKGVFYRVDRPAFACLPTAA